ncbi:hypothetical protein FLAG1_04034 [Fusarium langsethiae]|uniref:Uncharacterized protein n=1 Tax=Fusarium langsethiae TaxID=179993 RepID=A0A0N0DFU3_FUSLA|nr:hypothetical protein FLAG1_04034 [Fusarium langsethiae]
MPSWTITNDDKMSSWRDQLSPRNLSFRGFRRASESVAKTSSTAKADFTMMHHPDRPTRRITEADIPNDEECKKSLVRMRKASFAEQIHHRRHEYHHQHKNQLSPVPEPTTTPTPEEPFTLNLPPSKVPQIELPRIEPPPPSSPRAQPEQPQVEETRAQQPSRLTFGPFNGPFRSAYGPLSPAQEEPENADSDQPTTTTQGGLQVPESVIDIRKSILAVDDLDLATEPAAISEAKTIKLERVERIDSTPVASPFSSPRPSDASSTAWPKRKPSVQMVAIRRSSQDSQRRRPSVHTIVVRRPSTKPHADALSSHPTHSSTAAQVHVRQDSVSDPMCRVCHNGIAERSGTCSICDNDSMTATPVETSLNFSRLHYKPTVKKYNRPPPLVSQSLNGITKLHRPTASLTSDPEANQISPPASPGSRSSSTAETDKSLATGPSVPPTPMSALSTPEVFKRFKEEVENRAQADDGPAFDDPWMAKPKTPEDDVYEDDWADYYFDEQNFNVGPDKQPESMAAPNLHFVASPVCPGPGWI